MKNYIVIDNIEYNTRHGGPFDRGSADSYYGRPKQPHFYVGATAMSERIVPTDKSDAYWDYMAGYEWNERQGHKKYQ